MDEFGVLTERYGLKSQGKSAPMSASKLSSNPVVSQARNFPSHAASVNAKSFSYSSSSTYNSNSVNGSFLYDHDSLFGNPKPQNFGDGFDVFRDFQKNSSGRTSGSSFDYDSIFAKSRFSSAKSSFDNDDDDIFGLNSSNSARNNDDIFGSFASKPKPNAQPDDLLGNFGAKTKTTTQNGSVGFDDLIPGFGSSSASGRRDNIGITTSSFSSPDDPFAIFESTSTTKKSTFTDPMEEFSKPNHSRSSKPNGSSKFSSPLSPPPRPGQVLKADKVKSSDASAIDELEDFAMGRVRNNGNGCSDVHHAKEVRNTQSTKSSKYKEAEDAAWQTQQKSPDDLESFFGMGARSTSVPKSRATTLDTMFDRNLNNRGKPEVGHKQSFAASSGIKKASSTINIVDDLSSIFGDAELFGEFEEVAGETEERRRARLGRHQRTQDRVARAVADMNQRELQTQHEQEERRRIADNVDVVIKRWAAGKEGNMRALLSSLQYVLWPECGWEPVSLTDLITSTSVKKVYRKATLCVHPDKVQQKGATLEQKYTAEKVFDILKEAWNKFNKEELS